MKKILSLLLCIAMIAGILAGCGAAEAPATEAPKVEEPAATEAPKAEEPAATEAPAEPTTLKMWLPPLDADTEGNFKRLLADWEAEHNCTVELELIPWGSYVERWATGAAGGDTPDIGYMYLEMYPAYISSGLVMDLTDLVTEADYEEYLFLDRGEMMGGLYGVPIVTGVPFVIYYNQDILDSLGETAPETWEDFYRICEKATQDTDGDGKIDQYGYAVGLNSGSSNNLGMMNAYIYSLLWQAGGDIYTEDLTQAAFNNEAGVKAIEFFKSLQPFMPENVLSISSSDAFSTIFAEGKAAFSVTRSSSSNETKFAASYPNLKNWNYVTSLKDVTYGTFGAADCLSVMSTSENPELALELIKYITGAEFMTEYHKVAPGAPLTKSEQYVGDPKMERIVSEDRHMWRPLQAGPCGNEILNHLASNIQAVMEGKMTVKEALDDSAAHANELLDEYYAENG